MMSLGYSIGGIIGPVLAGWTFDIYHSYKFIFEIYAVLAALSFLGLIMIPRKKIEA